MSIITRNIRDLSLMPIVIQQIISTGLILH